MAGSAMARRLWVQGAVELSCVALLPTVFLGLTGVTPGTVAAWVAVCAGLVVGAGYWFARAYRAQRRLPATPFLGAFAVARAVLLVVLGVTFVVVVADIAAVGGPARWFSLAVWAFAVAEYVNYFHVQLSYQNRADLSRLLRAGRPVPAHLGRELARRPRTGRALRR